MTGLDLLTELYWIYDWHIAVNRLTNENSPHKVYTRAPDRYTYRLSVIVYQWRPTDHAATSGSFLTNRKTWPPLSQRPLVRIQTYQLLHRQRLSHTIIDDKCIRHTRLKIALWPSVHWLLRILCLRFVMPAALELWLWSLELRQLEQTETESISVWHWHVI